MRPICAGWPKPRHRPRIDPPAAPARTEAGHIGFGSRLRKHRRRSQHIGGIENLLHIGDLVCILEKRRVLLRRNVSKHRISRPEVVIGARLQSEQQQIVVQVVDCRASEFHHVSGLVLFAGSLVVLQPIVAVLLVVYFRANRRCALQRFWKSLQLVRCFETGCEHSLDFVAMVLIEFSYPDNNVGHLRSILLRRYDGDKATAAMGHVDVARRPSDHAVHTNVL